MKIPFTKMSGAGNDFVVVDNRAGIISEPHQFSISVCTRRLGIGADGVLMLEKSARADFKMRYYNADGTDAGMCGNGGRCIAKYAVDNHIVSPVKFTFEALGYIYHVTRYAPTIYELKMKDPFDIKLNQPIKINDKMIKGNYLNTGTDHSVIFLDENPELGLLESTDVFNIGRSIRYHQLYQPKGTNANFVSKVESNSIKIRTYERGVEDETLACGTGSVASALLSALKFGWSSPVNVGVKSGDTLIVGFDKNEKRSFSNVTLKGPAENIFSGNINLDKAFHILSE
ncbi:MAG: diaminopimelate epimerase [Bacteroidota bacterium]|nr:diaminopimelate epimerase [Bacteroidota bacterium]